MLRIPEAREELAAEAERVRAELADLPDFSETRQVDAYGFHGEHLPLLDEISESPRWTVSVAWGKVAKLEQVILVPAIDPRSGEIRGYGFPRRFRVLKVFPDGREEVVGEWMEEDCPAPGHVPLRIDIPQPWCSAIRIEAYRGAEEAGMEIFALGEIFGVVEREVWQAIKVDAGPEFMSLPYWGQKYLVDQKTGLGMPLGSAAKGDGAESDRDFSVVFEDPSIHRCLIDIDLGADHKMGWLTLLPAKSPSSSIVPGYGFPGMVRVFFEQMVEGEAVFKPHRGVGTYRRNPGDNSIRIPLYAHEGRRLRLRLSDFASHNGQEIFALGEVSVSMREKVYPVEAIQLDGFPEGADQMVGALTDGLVGGRPELQMMEWFSLIERQSWLQTRLDAIALADGEMEQRWSQARERGIILSAIFLLLALVAWASYRQFGLQRLRARIAQEQHQTEIEQMKLRFFTHISHELRTPLTVIPAPIERAMKQVGDGKLKTYLGVALKNVHELQQLVEQILDLRRIQDGKMKIAHLEMELVVHAHSIVDAMRPLAEEKGVSLEFAPSEESLVTYLDPEAIKRILGNLLGNAIKFTPSGGRVDVGVSLVRRTILLTVEDNGSGISSEDLVNVFEQHYRGESSSATHGSGIGLALVREVVDLLGGKVQVKSPLLEGRGSKFTVEIPLKKGVGHE